MFLLLIKNNNNRLTTNIKQLIYLKKLLIARFCLLKRVKKIKQACSTLKKKQYMENRVKYIIGISLSNTNINIYLADIKGQVKTVVTSGFLGLNGKQKTKKQSVIIKLLRLLLSKIQYEKNSYVTLHLKNCTNFYTSLILALLKKHLKIKLVRIFNNKPYNGCRPKKLKRKKRRRISFK